VLEVSINLFLSSVGLLPLYTHILILWFKGYINMCITL